MKLKTVEIEGKTYAEIEDGKPVYVDGEKTMPMDVPAMSEKIVALGREAKGHREAKDAVEAKLKGFDGIDDPAAALKALETMQNLDRKKLIDAGEVEKVKEQIRASYDEKLSAAEKAAQEAQTALHREMVGGSFARSKFVADNVAVPPDFLEARFGGHFTMEDGKVVAKGADGQPIYSRSKPGEPADFDEALSTLIDQYPNRDRILKGTDPGSGKEPGRGAPANGAKTITRREFDGLAQADRAAKVSDGYKVVDA